MNLHLHLVPIAKLSADTMLSEDADAWQQPGMAV